MKLKRRPGDFRVEEQIALQPTGGRFALYRLTKESLGTLEAVAAIEQRWRLPRHAISFAGLKDKHAETTQYLTIDQGPRRNLSQARFSLTYVGQASRPLHASHITGNRFSIVLRALDASELAAAEARVPLVAAGVPNYFDAQRFGSVGQSGDFIARPWCLGDYERAVWLAIADENPHDRPREREDKQILRERWGDWQASAAQLSNSHLRNIAAHLARGGGDFRRAIALLPQSLRSLWLAAFQAYVWNQLLARWLARSCDAASLVSQRIARWEFPFFAQPSAESLAALASAALPLPSARLHLEGSPWQPLYEETVRSLGLELRQMRVKYPRDSFFSKGDRPAVVVPEDLTHASGPDELDPSAWQLTLRFGLPRGSYATIVLKSLMLRAGGATADVASAEDDELTE